VKIDAQFLIRLYPRKWRERYGEELAALIGDKVAWRDVMDIIKSATSERLEPPTLAPRCLVRLTLGLTGTWVACIFVVGLIRLGAVLQHLSPGAATADAWYVATVWSTRSIGGVVLATLFAVLTAVMANVLGIARDHKRASAALVRFAPAAAILVLQLLTAPSLSRVSWTSWWNLALFDATVVLIGFVSQWALFADIQSVSDVSPS
jgi:hypothetical protein